MHLGIVKKYGSVFRFTVTTSKNKIFLLFLSLVKFTQYCSAFFHLSPNVVGVSKMLSSAYPKQPT